MPDTHPVEVPGMYPDEPRWTQNYKRCRAVDCSRSEQTMPEGFCWECWAMLQAAKHERERIVADVCVDLESLPTTYSDWKCLDAEEKGYALEDYFAIVKALLGPDTTEDA